MPRRKENLVATRKQIDEVWERASKIRGRNPDTWRRDEMGNPIRYNSYGTQGEYGWEIDHRFPKSRGGSDNGRNQRALYWRSNRRKSDRY